MIKRLRDDEVYGLARQHGDAMRGRRLSRTKKQPVRERQRLPTQPVPPSSSEEALQQAQAEGLALRVSGNKVGYFGVCLKSGRAKPYAARVRSAVARP